MEVKNFPPLSPFDFGSSMFDGYFAKIFANFRDFPVKLLVFEDFSLGMR